MSSQQKKGYTLILSIGIIILSISNIYTYNIMNVKTRKVSTLKQRYESLQGLQNLYDSMMKYSFHSHYPKPQGIHIVSMESIEFAHSWIERDYGKYFQPYAAIYSPRSGTILQMTLFSSGDIETKVHLTVQKGRAFFNESGIIYEPGLLESNFTCWQSPILWEEHTSETDNYTFRLPFPGWYTVSIVGPLHYWEEMRVGYNPPIYEDVEDTSVQVDFIHIWMDFRLLKNDREILFGVHKTW